MATLSDFGFHEEQLETTIEGDKTYASGFPEAQKRYRIIYENFGAALETHYFWILNALQFDGPHQFPEIDKIVDISSASEHSSLFGHIGQRMSVQQQNVSGYLKGISDMVRSGLWQQVREIRNIDIRLEMYNESGVDKDGMSNAAEMSLKDLWVTQVEGGGQNPSSVIGLANNVGFTILPDLFFRTHCKSASEVDTVVDKMDWNPKVKDRLKIKLKQYYEWKEYSEKELNTRRRFAIKYLRQFYHNIRMYMEWIKPYLRSIKRLTSSHKHLSSPQLIAAFESAATEIEILAKDSIGDFFSKDKFEYEFNKKLESLKKEKYTKKMIDLKRSNPKEYEKHIQMFDKKIKKHESSKADQETVEKKKSKMYNCILTHFLYVTKPGMEYRRDGYQNVGPQHLGRIEITFRSYSWSEYDIEQYKKYRDAEVFDVLGDLDQSISQAMDEVGEELKQYLQEAGEEFPGSKTSHEESSPHGHSHGHKDKPKLDSVFSPFVGVILGFKDLFFPSIGGAQSKIFQGKDHREQEKKETVNNKIRDANFAMWIVYKNFKKAHKMLQW